jgi:hypothetical protein
LERATYLIREGTFERNDLSAQIQDLLLENDRLKLQVEQKKTQYALLEEKKADNELRMKR